MKTRGIPREAKWLATSEISADLGVCDKTAIKILKRWRVPRCEIARTKFLWDKAAFETALKANTEIF